MSFKISNVLDYDLFLAIDIWSFKNKVLVCKIEWNDLKIVSEANLRQSKKDMINWEITDISAISKSVKKTILKACQNLDKIPKDVIVLFNSQDLVYDFTSVNYVKKASNKPITMKEIDEMIEDTELRSLNKIKAKSETRLGLTETEMKLITTSLVGVYIDGKRVSNPIWFTGKNIKFNIINVFCPVSSFSVFRNIIRDLDLNLISIVPLPISLPKLIEDTPYNFDSNIFIDIWYSRITIILQNNSEIIWFNILNFGYNILEEELKQKLDKSYLDIENILTSIEDNYEKYKESIDEIYSFIFESISVAIKDIEKAFFVKNVFLSWGPINKIFKNKLKSFFEENNIWQDINVVDEYFSWENTKNYNKNINLPVLSIAKAWKELVSIKKDPLVKILKYVIYKYE